MKEPKQRNSHRVSNMRGNRPKNNSKTKMPLRKKIYLVAFTLYLTFILLSTIPYIAELELRSRQGEMDDKYDYHLIFEKDGEQSHYIVERVDTSINAEIILTYTTASNTLNVETINIKKLTIDCKSIYYDESMKVFKRDPYADSKYYKTYFKELDLFTVIVKTDNKIDELRFKFMPEPVQVFVNDVEWLENSNYQYESDTIILTEVPKGTTDVEVYFKEKIPPVAQFKLDGVYPSDDKKKIYGEIDTEITCDASDSKDDDGTIEKYAWDFGDGSTGTKEVVTHKYSTLGEFDIKLTVTDNHGLTADMVKSIIIVTSHNDLDGDAMPDWWETIYIPKLDPEVDDAALDADGDGLTNLQEYQYRTDPRKSDSDNDDYSDYDEIFKHKTNATNPNSYPEEKGEGEEDLLTYLIVIAIIIVILILLVLFMLIRKRKRREAAEAELAAEDEAAAEYEAEEMEVEAGPVPSGPFVPPESIAEEEAPMPSDMYPTTFPGMELEMEEGYETDITEGIYQPEGELEPPLYKVEPEFPYGELEEEISHEDLAKEFKDLKVLPEEGIPGLEEGIPPEEGLIGVGDELPREELPKEELPGEELPGEELPKEKALEDEKGLGIETEEDILDIGGEELLKDMGMAGMVTEEKEMEKPTPEKPKAEKEEKEPKFKPKKEPEGKVIKKIPKEKIKIKGPPKKRLIKKIVKKDEIEREKVIKKEVKEEKKPREEKEEKEKKEVPKEKPKLSVKDYVRRGAIHFKNEEYSDAIIEWQKALDIESNHPEIVASIKEAMQRLKQKSEKDSE